MRALALLVLAPFAAQGVLLRWTPKENDELKYRTVGEFSVAGTQATLTSVNLHKVIRVDPDGSFTVQATTTENKVVFAGQETAARGMTVLTTYGPNGEIKEIRGNRIDTTAYRMSNLTEFHAPGKPVAAGDAWSAEGKADAKTGAVGWKADYKVVGEETVGPFAGLKIEVAAHETEGNDPGKATGTMWVAKDGVLIRTELAWSNLSVPGAPGLVSGKLTRTRLE